MYKPLVWIAWCEMRNLIPIKIASTLDLMTPTISFNAHADSKAMRKKEPRIFAVTAVGSAEGILETSLGYSFGQAFELSLAIGQGRENLEKDFSAEPIKKNGEIQKKLAEFPS